MNTPAVALTILKCTQHACSPVIETEITPDALAAYGPGEGNTRAIVFVDTTVWQRHKASLDASFRAAYDNVDVVTLSGGEISKRWDILRDVLEHMLNLRIDRRCDAVFAIGGGTVLDVVGLAASIYRRGISLTKIPTSLMAQVDAAVGLKNAINFSGCKNLVGSFAPPHSVLVDFRFLETLPQRDWANGIAEVIKLGLVSDASLIYELAEIVPLLPVSPVGPALRQVLRKAIRGIVERLNVDAYESNLQRVLDFGHWLSPQLEMAGGSLLHGEAVSIDMAVTLTISLRRGLLAAHEWRAALAVFFAWDLPTTHNAITVNLVQESLDKTSRHRGGEQNIPLCTGLGEHTFVSNIDVDEVLLAHRHLVHYLVAHPAKCPTTFA
ncbi:3-dehydroquinate synthase family protein [Paraburkholderia sediminicola]|uniref:3-dehydroquinate synthase family protein n=1 Tax=Paraburkholderia sediminicola TaxID=458836 RepID=UPI0038BA9205